MATVKGAGSTNQSILFAESGAVPLGEVTSNCSSRVLPLKISAVNMNMILAELAELAPGLGGETS